MYNVDYVDVFQWKGQANGARQVLTSGVLYSEHAGPWRNGSAVDF